MSKPEFHQRLLKAAATAPGLFAKIQDAAARKHTENTAAAKAAKETPAPAAAKAPADAQASRPCPGGKVDSCVFYGYLSAAKLAGPVPLVASTSHINQLAPDPSMRKTPMTPFDTPSANCLVEDSSYRCLNIARRL